MAQLGSSAVMRATYSLRGKVFRARQLQDCGLDAGVGNHGAGADDATVDLHANGAAVLD